MKDGQDKIGNFASTSGWTIGAKLPVELYASMPLISLTAEQQKRLEEVARPEQIVVSEQVVAALGARLTTRPLEPVMLKGVKEPVPLFEVLSLSG